MNWEAVGAIGEIVGALAVVMTLVFLAIQVRISTRATQESNQLERAYAMDRHAMSVAEWRGRLTENEELATLWLKALREEQLNDVELFRVNNLWIEIVNAQRSNYIRALTVGEAGLADQAVTVIAVNANASRIFTRLWDIVRPWNDIVGIDFNNRVDQRIQELSALPAHQFSVVPDVDWSMIR